MRCLLHVWGQEKVLNGGGRRIPQRAAREDRFFLGGPKVQTQFLEQNVLKYILGSPIHAGSLSSDVMRIRRRQVFEK